MLETIRGSVRRLQKSCIGPLNAITTIIIIITVIIIYHQHHNLATRNTNKKTHIHSFLVAPPTVRPEGQVASGGMVEGDPQTPQVHMYTKLLTSAVTQTRFGIHVGMLNERERERKKKQKKNSQ